MPAQTESLAVQHVEAIRCDDFDTYFKKRAVAIYDLIEKATGKAVAGRDIANTESDDEATATEEQEIFL